MKKLGSVFGLLTFAALVANDVSAADSKAVNIGGFVDAQAHWKKSSGSEGFTVHDAALYLSKEYGHGKVMVDLPFMWGSTTNNNFSFATGKAQAFLTYAAFDGLLTTTMGQFDTIYGFEANDSADTFFARSSFIAGAALIPTVHTGLMMSVKPKMNMNGNLGINAVVSNAKDQGQKAGRNLQYGGQFTFDNDMFRTKAGWLFWDQGAHNQNVVDFQAGATMKMVKLDTQLNLVKDFTDTADKWGFGMMVQAVASLSEMADVGTMIVFGRKMAGRFNSWEIMAGPAFHLNEDITVKANYIWNRNQAVSGGSKATTNEMVLSGVYKF